VIHLFLLLGWRPAPILPPPAREGESGGKSIAAVLVAVQRVPIADGVQVGAASVHAAPAPAALPRLRPARKTAEQPEVLPGRPSAEAANATGQLEGGAPSVQPIPDAVVPDGPSQESITRYRLELAREARRFKRYPSLARERGWEGVVMIAIAAVPGRVRPSVAVERSSGFGLLDEEAATMVARAVQSSPPPDGLAGRSFSFTLPIHYRLDD
jgi:protein TonB